MENRVIASQIKRLGQLMELYGENSFKIKAFEKASRIIAKHPLPLNTLGESERAQISGIGKSIGALISELLANGSIQELVSLEQKTPADILTMLGTKGIGPKKTAIIWQQLGIETLDDLWQACKADRLAQTKGFGAKTQSDILDTIEFLKENEGLFRYPELLALVDQLKDSIRKYLPSDTRIELTGPIRRRTPLVQGIDLLVEAGAQETRTSLEPIAEFNKLHHDMEQQLYLTEYNHIPVRIYYTTTDTFARTWIQTTGNTKHIQELKALFPSEIPNGTDEASIYHSAGLSFIPAELREGRNELVKPVPKLIESEDIKGCLHNHSLWSDGAFSIEDMAVYCRDVLHLQYFGISDHSRTAAYAGGLSIDRIQQQWLEIDHLNQKLAPFRIFKGIESDILNNGDLDYPDEILSGFDFVVASIHAPLAMDKAKATQRLIKAIENPYTTMLGHPTARQLLVRRGYPIHYEKVIDACAANDVIIEINSNPLRLDLDWPWLSYCLDKGVQIAINPDAHHTAQLHYMRYGVDMARKGGLQAENCLNCLNLEEIDTLLKKKKAIKTQR